jgi:hypothetical protein
MHKVSSHDKVLAAVEAVLSAVYAPEAESAIEARLRSRLGHGWSLTSAMQYLTGKSAQQAARSLSTTLDADARCQIEIVMVVANDYCATAHPSAELSSGLLVHLFRREQGEEEEVHVRGLEAVRQSLK